VSASDRAAHGQFFDQVDDLRAIESGSKDQSEKQARSAESLANEFSEFIIAASRLENSYHALQCEVSVLSRELSERNGALCASLAENERMRLALQQIVDSMPCGVLVLDCDGIISMINPESRRLLDLDDVEINERSRTTLRDISVRSGVNLEAHLVHDHMCESGQEFCLFGSGESRWIEVRNRQLFHCTDRAGKPDQTILTLRDVTAQKRSENERDAGRKAMALAELTTVLAHEIRNPLASLELFAELIESDEGRRSEWVSNLRAGIRSLSGTVNNVLTFHGSGSLKRSPIVLSEVISDAIQFAKPLADQAAISLKWTGSCDRALVMGNDGALRQTVLNLLSNAIRYTPAGGCITVSLLPDEDAGQIVLELADTGCGIRADQLDQLFEPGFSGDGESTGLGLAVCERIVKQHGGRISAANGEECGAQFTIHLPVFEPEVATA
jgi:signal transduction histidine kinase